MATRFKRFRAYFSGRPRACSACRHSHVACALLKVAVILFFSSVVSLLALTDVRGDSFVEFDYNAFSGSRIRTSLFIQLYDDRPLTSANFLKYVNGDLIGGLYNNSLIGPGEAGYDILLTNSANNNKVSMSFYTDLSGQWTFNDTITAYAAVNNVMDREPPAAPSVAGNGNFILFDPIGRSYKLGMRAKF